MTDDTELLAALAVIQARGAIGERSLISAVSHADRFVDLIPNGFRSLVDLGSGGGLPALVIAWRRHDVSVTMVERRATRADLLRRAVTSLGLGERTTVMNADVAVLADQSPNSFDVVTARSFADVAITARFIGVLLADGGVGLVSEPPADRTETWASALVGCPVLVDDGIYQGIRRLIRA
ncbi:MAG: class I SAM-dependent methyltransferase [Ilumatobacteraceae bacterium]|nr:class I SAM-dependent methyltransferase [Ilumatobacteraceae bacterium]